MVQMMYVVCLVGFSPGVLEFWLTKRDSVGDSSDAAVRCHCSNLSNVKVHRVVPNIYTSTYRYSGKVHRYSEIHLKTR